MKTTWPIIKRKWTISMKCWEQNINCRRWIPIWSYLTYHQSITLIRVVNQVSEHIYLWNRPGHLLFAHNLHLRRVRWLVAYLFLSVLWIHYATRKSHRYVSIGRQHHKGITTSQRCGTIRQPSVIPPSHGHDEVAPKSSLRGKAGERSTSPH